MCLKKEYGFKVSDCFTVFAFDFWFSLKGLKLQKRFMTAFSQSFINSFTNVL